LITQEVKLSAGLNEEVSLSDQQDSRSDDLPSVLQFHSLKGVSNVPSLSHLALTLS
jgi:hypothetical protein